LKVYFRDGFVDHNDATVTISNTCFLYGLGIFSGLRAHHNKQRDKLYLFRPKDHYQRLLYQAKMCHFDEFIERFSEEKFIAILRDLFRLNNLRQDAYVRITLFSDSNSITPKFIDYRDSFSAFLYPLGAYLNPEGVRCMTSSWRRVEDTMIPARGKLTGAYLNTAFAKTEAIRHGFDEALFLNSEGHVVEASAANIFIVSNDTLVTPPLSDDILEGITRKTILTLATDLGIPTVERSIDRSEIYKADEVFLTGTGVQIAPVIEVDHRTVGEGKIGPVGKKFFDTYGAIVRGESEAYRHWVLEV
jgi:branched-chain amino acid aminotransferase